MYIALIIAAILLIGHYVRPKDKQSYHIALMAIFGIAYFSIWRFVDFYLDVFVDDAVIKSIAYSSLMLAVVIIGLLPGVKNINRSYAIVLALLFALCVVPSFVLEKNIKNAVVGWGGYFDNPVIMFKQKDELADTNRFHHERGGFVIDVPASWQQKTHGSGMVYFVWESGGKAHAELRPRCFHNTNVSIPEIMANTVKWDQAEALHTEKQCFLTNKSMYTCFVRSEAKNASQVREKWRWLVTDKYQRQSIELDIIFYNNLEQSRQDAEAIINSLEFLMLDDPLPLCVSTVEWF